MDDLALDVLPLFAGTQSESLSKGPVELNLPTKPPNALYRLVLRQPDIEYRMRESVPDALRREHPTARRLCAAAKHLNVDQPRGAFQRRPDVSGEWRCRLAHGFRKERLLEENAVPRAEVE